MEAVDDVDLVAKDHLDGRKEWLGHIQDDHFNPIEFVLRTAPEPGHHLVSASAFERGNRLAFVQVDDQCVVAAPLAPGVFVNANGSPELSGAAPMALFKRLAKHGALGEAVATGESLAWTTPQEILDRLCENPQRRSDWNVTVSDGHLYIVANGVSLDAPLRRRSAAEAVAERVDS